MKHIVIVLLLIALAFAVAFSITMTELPEEQSAVSPTLTPSHTPTPPAGGIESNEWSAGTVDSEVSNGGVRLIVRRGFVFPQKHAVLFYAILAPSELTGWQLTLDDVEIAGPVGQYPLIDHNYLGTVQGVSLGGLSFSTEELWSGPVTLRVGSMIASNPSTGDAGAVIGPWRMQPLEISEGEPEPGHIYVPIWLGENCINHGDVTFSFYYTSYCEPWERFSPMPTPTVLATPPPPGSATPPPTEMTPTMPQPTLTTTPTPTPPVSGPRIPESQWDSMATVGIKVYQAGHSDPSYIYVLVSDQGRIEKISQRQFEEYNRNP